MDHENWALCKRMKIDLNVTLRQIVDWMNIMSLKLCQIWFCTRNFDIFLLPRLHKRYLALNWMWTFGKAQWKLFTFPGLCLWNILTNFVMPLTTSYVPIATFSIFQHVLIRSADFSLKSPRILLQKMITPSGSLLLVLAESHLRRKMFQRQFKLLHVRERLLRQTVDYPQKYFVLRI